MAGNQVSTNIGVDHDHRTEVCPPRLTELANRAQAVASSLRDRLLAPNARKEVPTFLDAKVAEICGIGPGEVVWLKATRLEESTSQNSCTLQEFQHIARLRRNGMLRPAGETALTIAIANCKGGVGKTTTAMVLAQGLSMRGHRVLAIDADPQGSLTSLFGILPAIEVEEAMTLMPLLRGDLDDITSAICSTYWSALDLVTAAPLLFEGEFTLPARQLSEPATAFWNVLDRGLQKARSEYDVIIIDTPPSLSYLTINALMAADGVVVPIPPTALDFTSLSQFWSLMAEFSEGGNGCAAEKTFDFVHLVESRVDVADAAAHAVHQWLQTAYGDLLIPVQIPKTVVAPGAAAVYGTVFDGGFSGSRRTYLRAYAAYERLVDHVEQSMVRTWQGKATSDPAREPAIRPTSIPSHPGDTA